MSALALVEEDAGFIINPELKAHIPPLRPDEFKQLEESILAEGCREAIVLWGRVIVDGHNRYDICTRSSLPFRTTQKSFKDMDDVKAWMEDNQLGRRNLTPENFTYYLGRKYARLKKSRGAPAGNSNAENQIGQIVPFVSTAEAIAAEHGVTDKTVKRAEKFANAIDKIGDRLGSEAKQKLLSGEIDATRAVIEKAADIAASILDDGGEIDLNDAVAAARRHDALDEIIGKSKASANDNHNHRAQGTGDNEWYTPAKYIDLARSVIGDFDLDPASNDYAQKTVRAAKYYTEETNGLDKPWSGAVWLNPPYAQPAISHFAEKMTSEWESGSVREAIVLTHNYTDTAWFHRLEGKASAICFTRGRIKFESPSGAVAAPTQGQAFFYFGPNVERFKAAFHGEVGFVR